MKNITHVFNKTPFKNSTYEFFATITSSEFAGPYYTPTSIKNFSYGDKSTNKRSIHTSMHDIAHIIDLWERGHKERLLLEEFGWRIRPDKELWPRNDLFKELRVLTLQSFLSANTFGWARRQEYWKGTKTYFRSRCKIKDGFLPTESSWNKKVTEYEAHCHKVGYKNYIKMWKEACAYVKANR